MLKIACIGEAMIELQEVASQPDRLCRAVGGDTLNTAIYLKRLLGAGADVHYVTQLGDDPYSDAMLADWRAEEINTSMIPQVKGALPGLYAIRADDTGEREFFYWRDQAPAKNTFSSAESKRFLNSLSSFDLILFSGITLAILFDEGRENLLSLCARVRDKGGNIAFDGNYRPGLWSNAGEARNWLGKGYRNASIALPTLDDERSLSPGLSAQTLGEKLLELGCKTYAIKCGAKPCHVYDQNSEYLVVGKKFPNVVDTTAAGDSFNAAFIAGLLKGKDGREAAKLGHQLAGLVITQPGAIIPAASTKHLAF